MRNVASRPGSGNLFLVALLLAPALPTGCAPDQSLFCSPEDPCPALIVTGGTASSTSSGQASSSSSGGGGAGGAGGCSTATDCPGMDGDCATRTCIGGVCGQAYAPPGTVVDTLAKGDCKSLTCNGLGGSEFSIDSMDFIDDANQCTYDYCESDGTTAHQPKQPHTPCGGGVCTDMGACVECVSAVDCPLSLNCQSGGTPTAKCLPPTCFDGIQNQGEKYADCGGPCPPCP